MPTALQQQQNVAAAQTPLMAPAGFYWPGLDGLRTLAFALVFFHHLGAVPLQHPRALANGLNAIISNGWLGVDLFFVISGFLMTTVLVSERDRFQKINFKHFYARRILRIWPAYYSVLTFGLLILPFLSWHWTFKSFAKFLGVFAPSLVLFLGNFAVLKDVVQLFHLAAVNHVPDLAQLVSPLWSLCIEEQFYLFLPLSLSLILATRARLSMFAGLIAVSVLCRYGIHHFYPAAGHDAWYRNTFSHFDPLMIGCVVSLLNLRFQLFARVGKVWPTVLAGSLLMVPVFCYLRCQPTLAPLAIVASAVGFAGLLILACSARPIANMLAGPFMSSVGRKTYCMYLWHCFVIGLVSSTVSKFGLPANTMPEWFFRAAVSFVITFGLAMLSWSWIEQPCNRLKKYFEPGTA